MRGAPPPPVTIGAEIFRLVEAIYPICRSITGDGVRQTLAILGKSIDIKRHEVPTGTAVFDWTIPKEWTIRDAYVRHVQSGKTVIDFACSNLAVLNYSAPVHARMTLSELKPFLYTDPDHPDVIPYRTSYYQERWGFCLPHSVFLTLPEGDYDVVVDATLQAGSLTYGECFLPGETDDEVLFSAHICHPSLANDNCSGLALLTMLARHLQGQRRRFGYRFLFAPGTIGSLAWLTRNEEKLGRIRHGLVVSCVGDGGGPVYKRSRRGHAKIDRAVAHVLERAGAGAQVIDFFPYGYDERQFCSPGFDLPVGLFQRSQFGQFPEYHTSADNLDLVRPEHLARSFELVLSVIDILERDKRPVNTSPKGEPQLGRRGLYTALGGDKDAPEKTMAMLWVLNLADGRNSLLDMAERAGLPFAVIADTADVLAAHGLLVDQAETGTISGQTRSLSDIAVGRIGQRTDKAGSFQR